MGHDQWCASGYEWASAHKIGSNNERASCLSTTFAQAARPAQAKAHLQLPTCTAARERLPGSQHVSHRRDWPRISASHLPPRITLCEGEPLGQSPRISASHTVSRRARGPVSGVSQRPQGGPEGGAAPFQLRLDRGSPAARRLRCSPRGPRRERGCWRKGG